LRVAAGSAVRGEQSRDAQSAIYCARNQLAFARREVGGDYFE